MMMMKLDYESSKKEERKRSVKFTFSCLANRLVQVCRRGWNCVILMKEGGWGRRAAWKSTTWYDLHIRTYFHISYNASEESPTDSQQSHNLKQVPGYQ